MKRLILLVAILSMLVVPAAAQSPSQLPTMSRCGNSVAISVAAGGRTELVALTAAKSIYVCSFAVVATTAVTVKFDYGTGVNCATSPVSLTGAMPLGATGTLAMEPGSVPLFKTATANALCINLGGGVQVSGFLTYAIY
jgi:hypothetical protein